MSTEGGVAPLWARTGGELFYVSAKGEMTAVSIGSGTGPRLGARRPLFPLGEQLYLSATEFYTPFDVAPDGRFLMARAVTPKSVLNVPLVVVDNWLEELKQKVGR